jgi:YbgC/YbaW family acyl-CoA thioester hydrolase
MAGIMHFSNYFRFMEAAETAFLRSLGLSVALSRGGLDLCLPRVHAECDYLAPLRFQDEVLIHLLVQKKGVRSLTYRFRFYRLEGPSREEAARGRIVLAYVLRRPDGVLKAAPLPGALARMIQQAPSHLLSETGPARKEGRTRGANHAIPAGEQAALPAQHKRHFYE